jgi:hypothetical protein
MAFGKIIIYNVKFINYATIPQIINGDTFFDVTLSLYGWTLYVPAESIDIYSEAEGWQAFPAIMGINQISEKQKRKNR